MSVYTKTVWNDSGEPAINAARLNNIENGIDGNTNKQGGIHGYSTQTVLSANTLKTLILYAVNYSGLATSSNLWVDSGNTKGIIIPAGISAVLASITLYLPNTFNGVTVRVGLNRYRVSIGTTVSVAEQTLSSSGNSESLCASYCGEIQAGDKISGYVKATSSITLPGNDVLVSIAFI